jgi:hypothetical protein
MGQHQQGGRGRRVGTKARPIAPAVIHPRFTGFAIEEISGKAKPATRTIEVKSRARPVVVVVASPGAAGSRVGASFRWKLEMNQESQGAREGMREIDQLSDRSGSKRCLSRAFMYASCAETLPSFA